MRRTVLALASLVLAAAASDTAARDDPADLCSQAADAAAARHGVPREVMRAITLVETGRRRDGVRQPWPWTVNMEGAGKWFDSRSDALAFVATSRMGGAVSFDIGCFQVNHRWHGDAFASVDAMFEPMLNADYAARFVLSLFEETGAWPTAAGYYHSRTPELAARYQALFETALADLDLAAPGPLQGRTPLIELTGRAGAGAVPRAVRPAAPSGGVSLAFFGAPRARPLLGWAGNVGG